MGKRISLLLSMIAFMAHMGHAANPVTFDYVSGEEGRKVCLRLPRGQKEVRALLYAHQNMTEEVLFRSKSFTDKMDSLGVAMAFIQSGSQN